MKVLRALILMLLILTAANGCTPAPETPAMVVTPSPSVAALASPTAVPTITQTITEPTKPSTQPVKTDAIPEGIKTTVRYWVDAGAYPGIVVGLVTPEGRSYFSYGKTTTDGDQAVDEDTVFEIGSVTKVFTTLLLADMVSRGEVSFDDPIDKYLPAGVTAPTYNGKSITLLSLATHTSGLPGMPGNFSPADENNPYADYTVDQMYDFLSRATLTRDVGTAYEYSNLGMGLLGNLLARRSGMSYEDLFVQRIANELGMPDTRITFTSEMESRLAVGHDQNGAVHNWDVRTLEGAGALRSTARDLLTFLAANLRLKESRLYPAMQTTHEPRYPTDVPNLRIALGWHILTRNGIDIITHHGATGGYWSFIGFRKDTPIGVVVLTNLNQSVDDIGYRLLELYAVP